MDQIVNLAMSTTDRNRGDGVRLYLGPRPLVESARVQSIHARCGAT